MTTRNFCFGASALLLAYVAIASWFGATLFTDEVYNHALVLRSSLQAAEFPLETSFTHWYSDPLPIVRPEDWHRSAYLVALSFIHEVAPMHGHTIVNAITCILLVVFAYSSALLLSRITGISVVEVLAKPILVFCTVLVVFSEAFSQAVVSDYMDDIPATLLALAGLCVFVLLGIESRTGAFASGVIISLAVVVKPLSLLLLPSLLLAVATYGLFQRNLLQATQYGVYLVIGFLAVLAPFILWNLAELGLAMPDQARIALNGRMLDVYDGEHQVYFVRSDISPIRSWSDIVAQRGLGDIVVGGIYVLTHVVWANAIVILLAILSAVYLLVIAARERLDDPVVRLVFLTSSLAIGMILFFALRLGEAGQHRYWLTLLALCSAMIGAALIRVTQPWSKSSKPPLALSVILTVVVIYSEWWNIARVAGSVVQERQSFYSPEIAEPLRDFATTGSIMLHTNQGPVFWRDNPNVEIVGMKPGVLVRLTEVEFQAFYEAYPIRAAAFQRGDVGWVGSDDDRPPLASDAVDYLIERGFCIVVDTPENTLLASPNHCRGSG